MRYTQMISFFTITTAVLLLLSCEPRNSDSETSASHNEELVEDYDETRVRQFGNTAVITGRSKYVSTEEDLGTVAVRHTMIWAKQDGRWQMVGWQGTALPGEEAYGPDLDDG